MDAQSQPPPRRKAISGTVFLGIVLLLGGVTTLVIGFRVLIFGNATPDVDSPSILAGGSIPILLFFILPGLALTWVGIGILRARARARK